MNNTSLKDDVRKVVAIGCTLLALFMLMLLIVVSSSVGGEIVWKEAILLGALFGIPIGIAFYLSVGRESVGGLPCAIVVSIGFSLAGTFMLEIGWLCCVFTIVVVGIATIAVQAACNAIDESNRR